MFTRNPFFRVHQLKNRRLIKQAQPPPFSFKDNGPLAPNAKSNLKPIPRSSLRQVTSIISTRNFTRVFLYILAWSLKLGVGNRTRTPRIQDKIEDVVQCPDANQNASEIVMYLPV